MGIFTRFFGSKTAVAADADETDAAIFIYARCATCGEKFRSRIVKEHELVQNFEGGPAFSAHKELVGGRCRTIVTVNLEFDARRRLSGQTIENGSFLTKEEYEAK